MEDLPTFWTTSNSDVEGWRFDGVDIDLFDLVYGVTEEFANVTLVETGDRNDGLDTEGSEFIWQNGPGRRYLTCYKRRWLFCLSRGGIYRLLYPLGARQL